jgi:hypothetical protein
MSSDRPWYRQLWPLILIALPSAAVIACIVTMTLALRHPERVTTHELEPVNDVLGQNSVAPPKE